MEFLSRWTNFLSLPAASLSICKSIRFLFHSCSKDRLMKSLKALLSTMEAQWTYNPCQVNQSPQPAAEWNREREREGKEEPESLWELSHVAWDSLSMTEEGKMRGAEHPEVFWNSSPCRMDGEATRCPGGSDYSARVWRLVRWCLTMEACRSVPLWGFVSGSIMEAHSSPDVSVDSWVHLPPANVQTLTPNDVCRSAWTNEYQLQDSRLIELHLDILFPNSSYKRRNIFTAIWKPLAVEEP